MDLNYSSLVFNECIALNQHFMIWGCLKCLNLKWRLGFSKFFKSAKSIRLEVDPKHRFFFFFGGSGPNFILGSHGANKKHTTGRPDPALLHASWHHPQIVELGPSDSQSWAVVLMTVGKPKSHEKHMDKHKEENR